MKNLVKKNKLTLNNLTKKQKETLTTAGIGLAGLAGAGGVYALMGFGKKDADGNLVPSDELAIIDNNVVVETATDEIIETENIEVVDAVEVSAEDVASESVTIFTDAPVALTVNDTMDFAGAFSSARAEVGAGGLFEWNGDLYNTYYKEEWDALTEDQQNEYLESMGDETLIVDTDNVNEDGSVEYTIEGHDIRVTMDTDADGTDDVFLVDIDDDGQLDIVIDRDGNGIIDGSDDIMLDVAPTVHPEGTFEAEIDYANGEDIETELVDESDIEDVMDDLYDVEDASDLTADLGVDDF